ncbi:histidinol dehydrogenase [Helicobacter sp. 11S02629-2]|uniref:histidinol dehydrogenase n=1 Tax=Helicobacter sp. 11S02629-2 TaxID=1476195 RepID=UPI000BA550D2|nr:histidinol dehydrogenase [Helicobacter sp. 11S02629-2]PAF43270.1 histidinol dehydrogenase [Helicobacter sp. 11S02629-2]
MIKILESKDTSFEASFEEILNRANMDMYKIIPSVLKTLQDIKTAKDESVVLKLVSEYDSWNPKSLDELRIEPTHMKEAYNKLDSKTKVALKVAFDRIQKFHFMQTQNGFFHFEANGNLLGQSIRPVKRAGLYIPGGKAAYPSSLLMNAIPAIVAGVKELVVTTPAPKGELNHTLLASMHMCDIKEGFKIGGVGAIGLMTYGVSGKDKKVERVDVVTGPGNIYVATAKKLVYGDVNIDMIAGPSEIGIIADDSADPRILSADLLSQAEHDELASSFLITPSLDLAKKVQAEIDSILKSLPRKAIASKSIDLRGAIIVTKDLKECVELMDKIAPEHLEVCVNDPMSLLPLIQNAGAIFLGHHTSEAIGDYLAGPNHTLPTGGSARFFSPLSVENFYKKTSLISFSKEGLKEVGQDCIVLAQNEGLDAHALSVSERLRLMK